MLMVVLIAFGTMQLAWMLALSVVIWLEKVAPYGDQLRRLTAAILVVLGVALLVHPTFVTHLISCRGAALVKYFDFGCELGPL